MVRVRPITVGSLAGLLIGLVACGPSSDTKPRDRAAAVRPSILLVTLDTTRADAVGPDAVGIETPAFNALVARGRRFRQAWATVPETLPSHASMLTGLYPGGHALRENGRVLGASTPLLAEHLQRAGYRTAAFVSSFALARRFGLSRGFARYDDRTSGLLAERSARETTGFRERAVDTTAQFGNLEMMKALHGVKALPAAPGDALGWMMDVVHWGGQSRPSAPERRALSFEFIGAAETPVEYEVPLVTVGPLPSMATRLWAMASGILMYLQFESALMMRVKGFAERVVRDVKPR